MSHHHHRVGNHLRTLLSSRRAVFHAQVIIHDIIHVPLVQGEFAVRWRFDHAQSVSGDNTVAVKKKAEESSSGTIEDTSEHGSLHNGLVPNGHISSSSSSSTDSSTEPGTQLRVPRQSSHESSYGQYLSPDAAAAPTSFAEDEVEIPDTFLSSAKGRTSWSPLLSDHSVSFNQRIDVVLDMFVDKETRDLQHSELKLEVLLDLPSIESKDRGREVLGVVYIDLAQYASAGADTRRHLLQKSKINAIMRVSIELTQMGGESNFVAPPLPAAQLMSGVAGLLDRERSLVGPGPIQLKSMSAGRVSSDSSLEGSPRPSILSRNTSRRRVTDSLAPSSLPAASTEAIINALFNPFPSESSAKSPFTIPAPPRSTTPSIASTLSRTDSESLRSEYSGQGPSRPFDAASSKAGFLAPSTQPTRFSPKRKETTEGKPGRWWKLGSTSRPTTPTREQGKDAPSNASFHQLSPPKAHDYAKSQLLDDRTIRRPPAIAVTDTDPR